jgi:hypothetical protein
MVKVIIYWNSHYSHSEKKKNNNKKKIDKFLEIPTYLLFLKVLFLLSWN